MVTKNKNLSLDNDMKIFSSFYKLYEKIKKSKTKNKKIILEIKKLDIINDKMCDLFVNYKNPSATKTFNTLLNKYFESLNLIDYLNLIDSKGLSKILLRK